MKSYYFYTTLLSFLCGVAIQTVYHLTLPTIAWGMCLSFVIALVAIRDKTSRYHSTLVVSIIVTASFSLGLLRFEVASWQFGHSPLMGEVGKEISLEGVVTKEPDHRATALQLTVTSETDTVLVTTDSATGVHYGDRVLVQGILTEPESFTTELGREFDYPSYLLVRDIEYVMKYAEVSVVESDAGNPLISFLLDSKGKLVAGIESVLPPPASGLGLGLLLGVKQALGDDIESAFRTSGLTHIIVLSGYNIMLVVTFVMFCLSFVLPIRPRIMVGIAAIVCFALIVGLSATVVRASVMAVLLLIAQLLGRTYHLTRALVLAGTVMVLYNPYLLLNDIGFQLSFMATLGLVFISPKLETFMQTGFASLSLKDFLLSTIATQIAVLPLLLYYIGEVSLVAVVVNVLVLPIVPFAMITTFVAGVAALLFLPLGMMLSFVAYLSLTYIITLATFFAGLPFAAITVPSFSVWWVFCMYAVLAFLLIKKTPHSTMPDEYSDWTIEEEKVDEAQRASSTNPVVPIFFR